MATILLTGGTFSSQVAEGKLTAENSRIIDCLLPGKVKKLGLRRMYVSKRRPVKTSENDCAIHGGEYTAYDRADIQSALQTWQSAALLGDAEAQFYVAEIFEKGMGEPPNYKQAHLWYSQAAAQSYSPALMALGKLYEAGLGVDKDLAKAMNYYREASGLAQNEIEYTSVFNAIHQDELQKIANLETSLEDEKRTSRKLKATLADLKSNLRHSNSEMQRLQKEVDQKKSQIQQRKNRTPQVMPVSTLKLESELARANVESTTQQRLIATLQSELKIATLGKTNSESERFISQELRLAQQALLAQKVESEPKTQELSVLQQELRKLQSSLERYPSRQQLTLIEQAFQKQKDLLERNLSEANTQIAADKKRVAHLEQSLSQNNTQNQQQLAQYQYEIEIARQSLLEKERRLEQQRQTNSILTMELEALQQKNKLDNSEQSNLLVLSKKLLAEKGSYYQAQLTNLNLKAQQQQENIEMLQSRLKAANSSADDKQAYVEKLKDNIIVARARAKTSDATIEIKSAELQQAYMLISELQKKLQTLPTTESLQSLQNTLQEKQKQLTQAQNNALTLTQNISTLEKKQAQTSARLDKIAPKDGPVIAIRWPKHVDAGGLTATVGAGSVVNIVGAVYPPNTITQFKIDGKVEQLDTNGLFLKAVEIGNSALTIHLLAMDDLGQKSTKTLTIQPSASDDFTLNSGGSLTTPKVKWGKYYALIIGNNKYDRQRGWGELDTAVNDAKALAKVLREKYDFRVTLKLNASRDEILLALEELRKKLKDTDNLLVYYAGHGYMDPENDQGYWIPVNGDTDSTINWVSNATVTDQIRAMSARNVMVIADSCYSATLMRSGVVSLRSGLSLEKRLQRLKIDVSTITRMALSSGGLQPVADAVDNSGHSVFANALFKSLRENSSILDGDRLATEVGLNVSVATQKNIKQVPRYAPLSKGGHQGGEFYFVARNHNHP